VLCRRQQPLNSKARCCRTNSSGAGTTQTAAPPMASGARGDLEGLSEKYWGEILERTVSSNSLQRLQRVYGHAPPPPPPPLPLPLPLPLPPPPARPNGNVISELRLFETAQIEI
jgi:hypothetical protein